MALNALRGLPIELRLICLSRASYRAAATDARNLPEVSHAKAGSSLPVASQSDRERIKEISKRSGSRNALDPTKSIFQRNRDLEQNSRRGNLQRCLDIAKQIKASQDPENELTYLFLIRALVSSGYFSQATSLFNELDARDDLKPDIEICNEMLRVRLKEPTRLNIVLIEGQARALNGEEPYDVLAYMESNRIALDSLSVEHLLSGALARDQLELVLLKCLERGRIMPPTFRTSERLVRCAADLGELHIAMTLLDEMRGRNHGTVSPETVMHVLRASAELRHHESLSALWQEAVTRGQQAVDEGTCIKVLRCSASHGDVDLGLDVLHTLQRAGCPLHEQHLVPVLDAYLRSGRIEDALAFLTTMSNLSSEPVSSMYGIIDSMEALVFAGQQVRTSETQRRRQGINGKTPADRLGALDDLIGRASPVSPILLTAVLKCAVRLGNLPLAQARLRNCAYYLGSGVEPSLDDYAIVAHACIDKDLVKSAASLFETIRQKFADNKTPTMAYIELRLILNEMDALPQQTSDHHRRQIISRALDLLDDLKELELPNVPNGDAYRWTLQSMVACEDPRLEALAHEMIEANHALSPNTLSIFKPDAQTRLRTFVIERTRSRKDEGG